MSAGRPGQFRTGVRACLTVLAGALLANAGIAVAPAAPAIVSGNYNLNIQRINDFHTYIWALGPTTDPACQGQCIYVSQRNQPIAKAYDFTEQARLIDGRWTMAVDDPFGLRCGNVYYGPTIPTHDVYTWDPVTMAGSVESHFNTDCAGGPPGSYNFPFALIRL